MAQQACTKPKPKPKPKLLKGFEPLTPRLVDPTRYHCAMKPLGCNNARFPMPEPNFASKPAAPRHKILCNPPHRMANLQVVRAGFALGAEAYMTQLNT